MYACGPTVYGLIHIGNARTFMAFDIVSRYFRYKGFDVKYTMNITDVGHLTDVGEDRIMKGAAERGIGAHEFARSMEEEFFKDLESLNIIKPDVTPRASEHIQDIIDVIKKLIENGYAYESNGFVYFDISKFENYGKLSRQDPEYLEKQRKETHGDKKHEGDFVLWFPAPENYPMRWESPWGMGFPGWHIECSTMSSKYLDLPFDIHGGGKDLIFPHHEDEIAQAEGATGKKFVNYWMHGEFILINGQKMSKSLGNIISARDFVEKWGAKAVRYFLMSSHYRTEISFTEGVMKGIQKTVNNLIDFIDRIQEIEPEGKYNDSLKKKIQETKDKFEHAMDDDFNMPLAFAAVFELVSETNKTIEEKNVNKENLDEVYEAMMSFDKVLGILEHKKKDIPKEVEELAKKREEARQNKNWEESDKIRDEIKKMGYIIEDTPSGYRIRKI